MNWLLQLFLNSITKRLDNLEKDGRQMAQGIDDLKQKVADMEVSEAATKQRVADMDARQEKANADLQKQIDDLLANPPSGMSDADAAALAARLQAVIDDQATIDPTAPTT